MLAVVVRLEGTLAQAGVPLDGALGALDRLLALGVPLVIAADAARSTLSPELAGRLAQTPWGSPAELGAPAFSRSGIRAIGDRLMLPPQRIYVISADAADIAAATMEGCSTIYVCAGADGPKSVATLDAAVDRLRGPYTRAALTVRAVMESFHARRRAQRAVRSDPGDAR